jgi:hypothetical protein
MGDTDEVAPNEIDEARPVYATQQHVLTASLNKLNEHKVISSATEQFIKIIKNPHCNIDEKMLKIKAMRLTRG